MGRTYLRVPRVQRLEYLKAFLRSFRDGEFKATEAQKAIQQQIHHFEVEKAKALGRQRPRMRKGTSTLQECLKLARHLRLIDRFKRLTPDVSQVLDDSRCRPFLLERIWQTYPRFRRVVVAARDADSLDLPFYAWGNTFRQEAGPLYSLEFDRLTFETIRDLATQLELINWYPTENKRQIVYLVASVVTLAESTPLTGPPVELESLTKRYRDRPALHLLGIGGGGYGTEAHGELKAQAHLVLQNGFDQVFIRDHDVSSEEFEQVLWKEYLELSTMRRRFPVLYPSLRNKICASLRISDRVFDQHLLSLIREPQRLDIYPSGGVLNYAANLAHLGKFLPPKTSQGNFIIYLKIDRRNAS